MGISFDDIKLIIWDLDNTFWPGSFSENESIGDTSLQIKLLKRSTDCGVINSICSKNDAVNTMRCLSELGVGGLFVLPSINWEPKGKRIQWMAKTLGFREENVLFIDDNVNNHHEALFYLPHLMVAQPSIIKPLYDYYLNQITSDVSHKRLQYYKRIELRIQEKKLFIDNLDFLFQSNIRVKIHTDCINVKKRLLELILRTNQLNYTKERLSEEELETVLHDKAIYNGYVTVEDKYGDYGVVGFFSVKESKCIHFLFSCRIIGLGVEEWVYCAIGKPLLRVVPPVVHEIDMDQSSPIWINRKLANEHKKSNISHIGKKVIFKGPCDIEAIAAYFNSTYIIQELTYVSPVTHVTIEHQSHSTNYLQFPFLSNEERDALIKEIPFNDPQMFDSNIYLPEIEFIFLSSTPETSLGVYKNKLSGYEFAWGEWDRPLTDRSRHLEYINEQRSNYKDTISLQWLTKFSNEWEYIGRITPEQYIRNLNKLFNLISPSARVCLLLGCEVAYKKTTRSVLFNRHLDHKLLNAKIRDYAKTNPRLYLINYTDYIHSDNDFTDSINHFSRRVYYEVAQTAKEIVAQYKQA